MAKTFDPSQLSAAGQSAFAQWQQSLRSYVAQNGGGIPAPVSYALAHPEYLQSHPELKADVDMISGVVPFKTETILPCVFKDGHPGSYWGWRFGETFEIDRCGMACALIRMEAFEKVKEPWFEWKTRIAKDHSAYGEEGEDMNFCRKLKEAGGKVLGDGAVLCGHITPEGRIYQLSGKERPFQNDEAQDKLTRVKRLAPA